MAAPNGVMMQYFHWYNAPDGSLWNELTEKAEDLAAAGFTALWLPPAYKGSAGGYDTGYGVYDMYDLGEFDQKGSVRTKYGTKDEYITAIKQAQSVDIEIYADVVLNHRLGGDTEEEFKATPYAPNNRNNAIGDEVTIKAWTNFNFSGRQGKYSDFEWHWWHFNAVDYNGHEQGDFEAIYLFEGKSFAQEVDMEKGSFDYLMGCDLDLHHPEVKADLMHWGEWYVDTTNV